jgi:hypothetical protein
MQTILRLCLRLGLFAVGLVFAASVMVMFMLLLAVWGARMLWLRLTGRPVAPFVMHFGPGDAFRRAYRAPEGAYRAPAGGDVVEVEARRLS